MHSKCKSLLLFGVFLLSLALSAATLLIEAEALANPGEWKNEGTFLLSQGKQNVASGTITVKNPGTMHVWVFAMTHAQNWRKANLVINGNKIGTFGDEALAPEEKAGQFHWVKAPAPVSLKAGDNTIQLISHSSSARIDRILLTTDPDYVPGKAAKLAPLPPGTAPTYIKVDSTRLDDTGLWQNNGEILVSGKKGVVATGTFHSPMEQKMVVWAKVMTFGGNFRKTDLSLNGLPIGTPGDEPLNPDEKPGWHWVRLPEIVTLEAGRNVIQLKASSDFSRISTIYFANTESFDPAQIKTENFYGEAARKLEGNNPRPKSTNPNGPRTLVLCGGRPWLGNSVSKMLDQAGLNVQLLNSVYLAGQGGAPIRDLLYLDNEPQPLDGVSYEFQNLRPYKMILITGMPYINQSKLLGTPERVNTLKKYVSNGGKLLLTANAPAALNELLPVEATSFLDPCHCKAVRPEGAAYDILPETWEIHDTIRVCSLKPGARLISSVLDSKGRPVSVYAASWKFGKGEVLFFNVNYERKENDYQYFTWVYGKYLLSLMAQELLHTPLRMEKLIPKGLDVDAPTELAEATVRINMPDWSLTENTEPATAAGNEIRFANGAKIVVKDGKAMDFYYPGQSAPYITNAAPPALRFTKKVMAVEASTSEATDLRDPSQEYQVSWHCKQIQGGTIPSIFWESENGDLLREDFKSGQLVLDGISYQGIAHRAVILKADVTIYNISFGMEMHPNGGKIRRFSCYQPPRGYKEYPLDGSQKIDTGTWGFFASGQPFGWMEGTDAVYAGFVESPVNTTLNFTMNKGETVPLHVVRQMVGNRTALPEQPVETPFYWHMLTSQLEAACNNGWMAMYQFQRHNLRKSVGFPEIPARPIATYLNTATKDQREAIIRKMGKAGFTFCYLPFCPSQMVAMAKPERIKLLNLVRDSGMRAFPWTPCGHTMGHPEGYTKEQIDQWWARNPDGKIQTYFNGRYPVLDQSNAEYRKWYWDLLNKEIDAGVGTYWFDMAGTAASTVNFQKPNSGTGLSDIIDIYRHMFDRGQCAITEGENPLAIDGFIYRRDAYTPMKGKEYLLLGRSPESDVIGFVFDFFRLSMFDCFMYVPFDDYDMDFERYPGEAAQLKKIVHYLPAVQQALDTTGMPFIRETPFGTTWISPKGGAIFFYHSVKDLSVQLPDGYVPVSMTTRTETVDLQGKMPASVPAETIVIFRKN